jgi:hypothetical protein
MTNWIIYSPFSKNSIWGQLTDQMNRTDVTVTPSKKTTDWYLSINDTEHGVGKTGLYMGHWSKVDSQFQLDLHPTTKNLIAIKPNSLPNDENRFQKTIDTDKIKSWLEEYEWVGFGYIIVPEQVDRFRAMERTTYYTRNKDHDFLILPTGQTITDQKIQPIQTWFVAVKASPDLIVIFCHPDVLTPNYAIDYKTDINGDQYFCYLHENFDFYDMILKPKFTNALVAGDTLFSKDEWIDIEWGAGSYFNENINIGYDSPKPIEIITDNVYTETVNGIRVQNQKGGLTIKYQVANFLKPSIRSDLNGWIEKNYIILG